MENNQGRKTSCPSRKIEWQSDGQFWMPSLDVMDFIVLVRPRLITVLYHLIRNNCSRNVKPLI